MVRRWAGLGGSSHPGGRRCLFSSLQQESTPGHKRANLRNLGPPLALPMNIHIISFVNCEIVLR